MNGPTAATYLARALPERKLTIEGLGDYAYIDREIVPARTTAGRRATMANRFDDEARTRSTSAIKADLLLRSLPNGRPTIGEVKVRLRRATTPTLSTHSFRRLRSPPSSQARTSAHGFTATTPRRTSLRKGLWTFSYSFSSSPRAVAEKHTGPSSSNSPASSVPVSTRGFSVPTSSASPSLASRLTTTSFGSPRGGLSKNLGELLEAQVAWPVDRLRGAGRWRLWTRTRPYIQGFAYGAPAIRRASEGPRRLEPGATEQRK